MIGENDSGPSGGAEKQVGVAFSDVEAAARALCDSDPMTRADALFALLFVWNKHGEYREECIRMAFEDPDPIVRSRAIGNLAGLLRNTANRGVCCKLAKIVIDELQDRETRLVAYVALVQVAGVFPVWEITPVNEFRFPDDVDPDLISNFL